MSQQNLFGNVPRKVNEVPKHDISGVVTITKKAMEDSLTEVNKKLEGKIKMSLTLPRFIKAIARTRQVGQAQSGYSEESWKKVSDQLFLDACLRHINAYRSGEIIDTGGEHHLTCAATNLMFIIEKYEKKKEKKNADR